MNDGIASRFYEKNRIEKLKTKIKLLGINYDPYILFGTRLVLSFILLIILLVVFKIGYILAPLITILFYWFSGYCLIDLQIKKRREKLEKEALDYFSVMLLSLNGHRSIKKAIELTCSVVNNTLSLEFLKVLDDIAVGKSVEEALTELEMKIPSEPINNIILSMCEANKLGNDIKDSVMMQLDYIRERKRTLYISKIRKEPIILALVGILVFTLLLIVLVLFKAL